MADIEVILKNVVYTSNRIPRRTWKPVKPGDLNFICPGPEIAWNLFQKVRKPGQNKTLDKTWNVKIYNISILCWDNFFQVLYPCNFRMPLAYALEPTFSAL